MSSQVETTEPYRPSNGTEGEIFEHNWCNRCEKNRGESKGKPCDILVWATAFDIDDPSYPKEWVQTANVGWQQSRPRCTAFVARGVMPDLPAKHRLIKDERQIGLPF